MKSVIQTMLLLLFLLGINRSDAQQPAVEIQQLPNHLGFNNRAINDILQDHHGFLWLATWSGLAKYDGYQVKVYGPSLGEEDGLKSNKIKCLFEDSKHRLWIGTNYTGFYRYDREHDKFIQYINDPRDTNSLSNNNVSAITEDRDGYLWIGTETGLNRFDPKTKNFRQFLATGPDQPGLRHNFIYSLAPSADGGLWVGCEVGLHRMIWDQKKEEATFLRYDLSPVAQTSGDFFHHNFIRVIRPSKMETNTLWIGTSIGLKKVSFDNRQLSGISYETFYNDPGENGGLSHSYIADIMEDEARQGLWIATYGGLDFLQLEQGKFTSVKATDTYSNPLSSNMVKSLFKDQSEVLWIGTGIGLNKINLVAKPFYKARHTATGSGKKNIVSSIVPAKDRSGLWIAMLGEGLQFLPMDPDGHTYGPMRRFFLRAPNGDNFVNFISELTIDEQGNIWLATQGAGVLKINESAIDMKAEETPIATQYTMADQLRDDYIMSLTTSASGGIWIGYWDDGIAFYDSQRDSFLHFDHDSESAGDLLLFPVVKLLEFEEGPQSYLWAGTTGAGLFKFKHDAVKGRLQLIDRYRYVKGETGILSNNFISYLLPDQNGVLWIGTENGLNGLALDKNTFTYFFEKDGLKNGNIQAILKEDNNSLWVSTQNGISNIRWNGGNTKIRNYDMYDGLGDNFFHGAATHHLNHQQMIFGAGNGLTYFDPKAIKADSTAPKVTITDLRLFNKSVPVGSNEQGRTVLEQSITKTKSLHLTHRENVVSFEFVGLQFNEPEKIRYAYQLVGFDQDWVYTDASRRIAHYTNLPYATYQFKVKAANPDGFWSPPTQLALTITPPFWRTPWAYALYAILFCLLLLGVRKITQMRAAFEHSLQLERLEREKLEEVNRVKLQFFTNISHELRTPLTLIISPLEQWIRDRSLDQKMNQTLRRMNHNAHRLLTLINQLLEFRKNEAGLMKLQVHEQDFVSFSKEIVSSFSPLAEQRAIQLDFQSDVAKMSVWFDRDQIEKVLYNLLSNAFKFTPENGAIAVQLQKGQTDIRVCVSDTGSGIAPGELPFIFDRFYQAQNGEPGLRTAGSGIGLALSKAIVEKHSGQIRAESQSKKGSTFCFTLPLGSEHFSEEEMGSGRSTDEQITPAFSSEELPTVVSKNSGDPQRHNTILLVEDNEDIRNYLKESLQVQYRISEAADGKEGLQIALSNPPDLIIADIAMPRMNGIELCRRIKSDIHTSHIPVILLTARTSLVYKIDGLETGADDYITKPFHLRLLQVRIKNLIDSRRELQKKFSQNLDLSPTRLAINSLDEKFLGRIKKVIEQHLEDSDFSVEQLASALHMSRMQLYRKLKSLTGKAPNQVIRSFRLKRAAQLLESKQYTVSEVTYMVGYNDLKSFREQFKKEFGMKPSVYGEVLG